MIDAEKLERMRVAGLGFGIPSDAVQPIFDHIAELNVEIDKLRNTILKWDEEIYRIGYDAGKADAGK